MGQRERYGKGNLIDSLNIKQMKLFIKYMVCIRCKMIVKQELDKLGLGYGMIALGEVEIYRTLNTEEKQQLKLGLSKAGLELLEDQKAIFVERIKNVVIEMVHYSDELPLEKNSDYISQRLDQKYGNIAAIFSETTGITIEHYIISHKIEKAKELIIYDDLNLAQIALKLGYKSPSHLSSQFKKVTGHTPTFFKQLKNKRRIPLEDL